MCRYDENHKETETAEAEEKIIREASCENMGTTSYTAKFTNEAFETKTKTMDNIEALGHDWGEWVVKKAASDTEEGLKERVCKRDQSHKDTMVIPREGHEHSLTKVGAVDAKCTESGHKEYYACSQCSAWYADAAGKTQVSGMDVLIPAKGHTEGEPEKGDVTPADCESVGGYNLTTRCKVCGRVLSVERIVIPMTAHEWSVWSMTIAPTENTDGEKRRSCSICGTVETRIVPKLAPGGDPNQKGTDGTAVGPGASAAAADEAITGMTSDEDLPGSVYGKLQFRSTKQTRTGITLKWTKPAKAAKFVLYGNKCGAKNQMKKLATYTGSSKKLTKVAEKKIKEGTYYKFIMVALDKDNNVVSTSKVIHVATKGGKVTNPKKVTVRKGKKIVNKVTVKKGRTVTVKSSVTKVSRKLVHKNHRRVKYESSNTKIATVTSKGMIKGVKKGSCCIYAYAQNGVSKKVRVVVK